MKIYSSHIISSFLLILLLTGCGRGGDDAMIEANDSRLHRSNGHIYLDGTLYSGTILSTYPDGTPATRSTYSDGLLDGESTEWYADGTRMETRFYVEGKKSGVHQGWWEDGSSRFLYHFTNDLHTGEAVEWYPDGTVYRRFHYVDGKEEGTEELFNEDGTIRANYVVHNGRRYGSMGAKPCRSPGDDRSMEEIRRERKN